MSEAHRARAPALADRETVRQVGAAVRPLVAVAALLLTSCRAPDARPLAAGAIERAAQWMAGFPQEQLRFDAAVGLAAIRRHRDTPQVREAFDRARVVAERDADNPMLRAIEPSYRAPPEVTTRRSPPDNVNRPLEEVIHCAQNGLRQQTLEYITGPMRDRGGYGTTHAVWALALARDAGCIADFAERVEPLLKELRDAQPDRPQPNALAVDLFAERVLMLAIAGGRVDHWAKPLLEAQNPDGSFGALGTGEDPYHRYHATMVAAWALSEWAK